MSSISGNDGTPPIASSKRLCAKMPWSPVAIAVMPERQFMAVSTTRNGHPGAVEAYPAEAPPGAGHAAAEGSDHRAADPRVGVQEPQPLATGVIYAGPNLLAATR